MLQALKFVKGAVSRKDFQPALTHFLIKDGRVMGYDGVIALSSPINLDIEAAPKALPFFNAIQRCQHERTSVTLTAAGKLTLKSGSFRATVECAEEHEVLQSIKPEGDDVATSEELLQALGVLEPFIGTDASRPWAMGILLRNYSAYVTNNIVVAQYWLGEQMPDINLPASAIREITRIGENPTRIQLGRTSATFHFTGDRWLRTQLLSADWPDVDGLLETAFDASNLADIPAEFFSALETLTPFVEQEGRILFRPGCMTTSLEGDVGATVEIAGLPDRGAYHFKQLKLLEGVSKIDFTKHPKPCPFVMPNVRGVFLGMNDV